MLLPGDWVEVRSIADILRTLDPEQSVDGLTFMPEMAAACGGRYRVALRAERTCVHPPEFPMRRLERAVTLDGLRCDGSFHGSCQLGCMLFWKEDWLRQVSAGASSERRSAAAPPAALRAVREPGSDRYMCQATALPSATTPGDAIWRPSQYGRFLRVRTFTLRELAAMLLRPARRRVWRMVAGPVARRAGPAGVGKERLGLQPGELVEVLSRDEIARTLDVRGMHRGLSFGGDMAGQCGRRLRVDRRVERIIVEATGRLRSVDDTVILEGSVCDRYFGCARGMPFLWREAWLRRVSEAATAPGEPPGPQDRRRSAGRRVALAVKRGLDIAGATTAVVILAPVLAWTALAVAATQGLPILFRQRRPGLGDRQFTIRKFRTMRLPRRGEVFYMTDDERITRLGRILRSTSIDELPELWNVLRGDMSLVGPRPLLTEYLASYTPDQRRRHDMRPGITGWAAVHGRHSTRFEDRLALDVWYVDNWSLWLDLRIIAMTVAQVLRRQSVSTTQDLEAVGFPLPGVGNLPPGGDGS